MNNLYRLFRGKDFLPFCYLLCMLIFSFVLLVANSIGEKNEPITLNKVVSNIFSDNSFANLDNAPNVSARSACVIDANSRTVIFDKNKDEIMSMASTTKIMTALVALENLPLDKVISINKKATGIEGSSIYLAPNEQLTTEDLLYGLMLESGNDAASAIAYAVSGSEEKFVLLMNEKAKSLGLSKTSFANPHGLSNENHYTTAYELAKISAAALENEAFKRIVSSKSYKASNGSYARLFVNHNKMLKRYVSAIGIKTGFTREAGRCLVSAAEKNGEIYVAVTLNAPDDWNDHTNLLNYAFFNYNSICCTKKGEFIVTYNGKTYKNTENVFITINNEIFPILSYNCEIANDFGNVTLFTDGVKKLEFGLVGK